ncbi:MAG: hypothetical protein KJ000_32770 [Pirellulaceae bacterium]|nr:hypothetical protein [Pirellulaceae bacterium]
MRELLFAGLFALTLTTSALAADTAVKLTADDLLRLARPSAGECYAVKPPANVTGGPEHLFAWRSDGGAASVRVPVPADGYYAVSSLGLWGPWAEGRLGRFVMTGGDAKFPGAYQGWYGTPPDPPYRLRDFNWGVAYLTAPAVDLSFEPAGGGGRLLVLADLKLQPRSEDGLKPEDRDHRVPAAVTATDAAAAAVAPAGRVTPSPVFDAQQVRGNEWTVFVPHVKQTPKIDGNLSEWGELPIVIDASLVPQRGWATPPPEGDADLSARVAVSWDGKHLYLAALVRDDQKTARAAKDPWGSPFNCDSLVVNISLPGWLASGVRSQGAAPLQVSYGLSYYAPGVSPRPLGSECRYAVNDTVDGYALEAAISFASMGWKPAMVGDRFPLGLILVDVDPHKPGGLRFDQYGWNYGPGSTAGTGEARLMGAEPAAGEIIAERETLAPGAPLRYVGTIDAQGAATLQTLEVAPVGGKEAVASFALGKAIAAPGRYRVWGQLPLPTLPEGQYEVRMLWK